MDAKKRDELRHKANVLEAVRVNGLQLLALLDAADECDRLRVVLASAVEKVRGLKEASALIARIRNKIVPLGVRGYLDDLDRARELIESIAAAEAAPKPGDENDSPRQAIDDCVFRLFFLGDPERAMQVAAVFPHPDDSSLPETEPKATENGGERFEWRVIKDVHDTYLEGSYRNNFSYTARINEWEPIVGARWFLYKCGDEVASGEGFATNHGDAKYNAKLEVEDALVVCLAEGRKEAQKAFNELLKGWWGCI